MTQLLSTKELAQLLGIHEKKVYKLVSEQRIPATKVTGKWLFPKHLVEQWIAANTINHPGEAACLIDTPSLLVVAGSNDILLDRAMALFMKHHPEITVVFGNLGSMGGLRALGRGVCHMASSHLVQEDEAEYNFSFAAKEMENMPAVVNFCFREQGLVLPKGNPKNVAGMADLARKKLTIVNRAHGTGTRLWFDRKLDEAGVSPGTLKGYDHDVQRHLDVGLEVLSGRADTGPAIRAVAHLLDLDFLPMHWERFDLLIPRSLFFDKKIQAFLSLLTDPAFTGLAETLAGYDLSKSGKMVYPRDSGKEPV